MLLEKENTCIIMIINHANQTLLNFDQTLLADKVPQTIFPSKHELMVGNLNYYYYYYYYFISNRK